MYIWCVLGMVCSNLEFPWKTVLFSLILLATLPLQRRNGGPVGWDKNNLWKEQWDEKKMVAATSLMTGYRKGRIHTENLQQHIGLDSSPYYAHLTKRKPFSPEETPFPPTSAMTVVVQNNLWVQAMPSTGYCKINLVLSRQYCKLLCFSRIPLV